MENGSSYDQIPYPTRPYAESHPDRLATIGRLFGLQVQPIDCCRVLELGCARGGNLIPMAEQLPGSRFVGVDRSAAQIGEALDLARRLGLDNLRLLHQDILDCDAGLGQFDYIVCHGVFSWAARQVQEKILEICASHLAPQGVAYVSYNTYPGWYMRGMVRDMMRYHVRDLADPAAQLQQARWLLDFLAQNTAGETPYGAFLRSEAQVVHETEDGHLLHDQLEEINDPLFFFQFVQRAEAQGLQYLAESDIATMWSRLLPPGAAATLEQVAAGLTAREQYMDFVRNRAFRQTLLCHGAVTIYRELRPEVLGPLHVAAPLAPIDTPIDLGSSQGVRFRHLPSGQEVTATSPIVKAALACLGRAWPAAIPFAELGLRARAWAGGEMGPDARPIPYESYQLGRSILEMFLARLAEVHSAAPRLCTAVSPRPIARRLARFQAESGPCVTNMRHQLITLPPLLRHILPYLDGRNDHRQLQAAVACWTAEHDPETRVPAALDEALADLARAALLVG